MQEVVSEYPTNADARERVVALIPQAIELAFPQAAKRLKRAKHTSLETGSRACNLSDGLFYRHWPYCLTELRAEGHQNVWLPLGRQYKPISCKQDGFYDYEQYAHLAWQFTCDPRQLEGGWRVNRGDRIYLYKDGETDRVRDFEVYLRRVGRLIAAGTGENAMIYAGRLLSTLPKK
jgi:hypothetical protein